MREKSNSFEIQRIGRSTSFKVLRSSRNSTQLPTKPPLQIFQAGCMQRRTEPPLQIFQAACAATCKSCPTINGSPGPSPGLKSGAVAGPGPGPRRFLGLGPGLGPILGFRACPNNLFGRFWPAWLGQNGPNWIILSTAWKNGLVDKSVEF